MNRTVARLLTRLYPRRWRERYAQEFAAFLEDAPGGWRATANIVSSAIGERIFSTQGENMKQPIRTFGTILRQPSAFLPLAMSFIALTILMVDLAAFGIAHEVHQKDEGTVAHLWQILMAGQLPIVAYFAIRWMPPRSETNLVNPCFASRCCARLNGSRPVSRPLRNRRAIR